MVISDQIWLGIRSNGQKKAFKEWKDASDWIDDKGCIEILLLEYRE
jgi:hypothetical protein